RDIVVVVQRRIGDGLADIGKGGAMQNRGRAMRAQHGIEPLAVADIADLERTPFDGMTVTAAEIVIGDGHEARTRERLAAVATHVTCAAGDKYGRHELLSLLSCPRRSHA